MILNLYKQRGETPLECILRFREAHPELKDDKWTYMGRLDPLAEGVLLVASGKDVKRKEEFLKLDKEYDFTVLFGFATDTYDVLGKILKVKKVEELNRLDLIKIAKIYEGEREQKYPFYSSKIIASQKRLSSKSPRFSSFHSARLFSDNFSGKLETRDLEEDFSPKKITIYKMQFHGLDEFKPKELFGRLLMDIGKVKGDFRQVEVLELWKEKLKTEKVKFLGNFSAHVSSGTYIRSIANDIGNTLGCGACTLSIKRTRVGDYFIKDSII